MRLGVYLTAFRAWCQQWSVKTRRTPSRHCRGARVYGHTTTVVHDIEYTPPPRLPNPHSPYPSSNAQALRSIYPSRQFVFMFPLLAVFSVISFLLLSRLVTYVRTCCITGIQQWWPLDSAGVRQPPTMPAVFWRKPALLCTLPHWLLLLCQAIPQALYRAIYLHYSTGTIERPLPLSVFFFSSLSLFYFPAQLAGGFTHSDLLDEAVVTGVVPSSPRYIPSFLSRIDKV